VIDEAVAALRAGGVAIIPTDTVYGVAVALDRPRATEALFVLKARPRDSALPVLVADRVQADKLGRLGVAAGALADHFWPGPLTIVVARQPGFDADLGGDAGSVGLRVPDHAVVAALCREVGPLATTSANLHGGATPETAAEVAALFGDAVAAVVDGGRCAGEPSTVVDCLGRRPRLLREGRIAWTEVREQVEFQNG
jgi:tRNA threonylcarbamoyl adenosine modification protein (Sua5/YciO/YrdC/YwlC family)